MTTIDTVLLLFFLLGAIGGYRNGFILSLCSLLAIVLGILAGFRLMGLGVLFLSDRLDIQGDYLPYLAFAMVFILVVILVHLAGRLIKAALYQTFLGSFDRAAGAVIGILKTAFLLSVAFWILDSLAISFPAQWTSDSLLYPMTVQIAPKFTDWIGTVIPAVRDLFGS